ncbi:MAG: hypothetical protein AAGJ93_05755 [Bacteroidota bacterium]
MKKIILLLSLFMIHQQTWSQQAEKPFDNAVFSSSFTTPKITNQAADIRWPWTAQRKDFISWWTDKMPLRIIESFKAGPRIRYMNQASSIEYLADETVFGGKIRIDTDVLNEVNFPSIIESRLDDIVIELPTGMLGRSTQSWTTMSQLHLSVAGVSVTGSYWAGAMAPRQFPQPQDFNILFNREDLVELAVSEIAATSALNNAVSLEVRLHPLHILSGFRQLEFSTNKGFYLGGDFAIGWLKATDLTFRQGRELLGDIDMGQEIRDILPDALESLINTDEAGELLLTSVESRIPLYGFGIPLTDGRTFEIMGWAGYQWTNKTWSGDARIGFIYQRQELSNEHPSNPVLSIRRWSPTLNVKWVFSKEVTRSSLFSG